MSKGALCMRILTRKSLIGASAQILGASALQSLLEPTKVRISVSLYGRSTSAGWYRGAITRACCIRSMCLAEGCTLILHAFHTDQAMGDSLAELGLAATYVTYASSAVHHECIIATQCHLSIAKSQMRMRPALSSPAYSLPAVVSMSERAQRDPGI